MSLNDILPDVQLLSRIEKVRLIQLLAQELERDEGELIASDQAYALSSPERDFAAAAQLLEALEDDKGD